MDVSEGEEGVEDRKKNVREERFRWSIREKWERRGDGERMR